MKKLLLTTVALLMSLNGHAYNLEINCIGAKLNVSADSASITINSDYKTKECPNIKPRTSRSTLRRMREGAENRGDYLLIEHASAEGFKCNDGSSLTVNTGDIVEGTIFYNVIHFDPELGLEKFENCINN